MYNDTTSAPTIQAPAIVVPQQVTPKPRPRSRSWTWPELVATEPRLLDVARWAATARFSWTAYEALKVRMRPLVGSAAQQPELRTRAAWDAAGQYLVDCMQRGTK